jgi:hypothetical protein
MAAPHQRATRGSNGANRGTRPVRLTTEAAKNAFVEHIKTGMTVASALDKIGYAQKTYEEWRRKDADFKARVDQARQLRKPRDDRKGGWMSFAAWRKKYLHQDTYWHQHQWIDVLEGRDPRELHPSQIFEPGNRNRLLINVPPEHAKTTTISTEYVAYRLCMDPSYRAVVISAGEGLAKSIVYDVQQILTSPEYIDLQLDYAPDGGWEATAHSWTATQITFGSEHRAQGVQETHQKDPNLLALGMGSKIYGRRIDLVIADDCVDTTNVSQYAKQITWLRKMVESRVSAKGRIVVVGTRIASVDLYSELRKPENYANGRSPWTYFASPAILEEGETPERHVTLWPKASYPLIKQEELDAGDVCICNNPDCAIPDGDGLYPKWDGVHLELGPRSSNNNSDWALVYQQKSVAENATFPEHAIQKATNSLRLCGRLEADRAGHPFTGMHDKYIIGGCDPAISGFAGLVVIAVDRNTQKRYVLTAVNLKGPTTKELQDRMKELTEFYGIHEWRVEKTGLLKFFTQHAEFRQWFQTRGVRFTEHETGSNKWDSGFGVSSMASLLGEYDKAWDNANGEWRTITEPLIEFPRSHQEGMKALIHQLIIWTPELNPAKVPCDLVMALWFANTGAREHLGIGRSGNVISFGRNNKFVSPRQKNHQRVSLADYRQTNH